MLEDVHWADDATLDVLRLLARRVEKTSSLVVVTYRHDELPAGHPLRLVLGGLATAGGIRRLLLEPLSAASVRELAVDAPVDPDALFRRTGGNPFFVVAALAAGDQEIPETVRDAVLGRAGRLDAPARELLDLVSAMPDGAELAVVEAVTGNPSAALEEAVSAGNAPRRRRRRAVQARARARGRRERARAAARAGAAPVGARGAGGPRGRRRRPAGVPRRARRRGRRDAGARPRSRAARVDGRAPTAKRPPSSPVPSASGAAIPDEERIELLDLRSRECALVDEIDAAVAAAEEALALCRARGDALREGALLRRLSRLRWFAGSLEEAGATSTRPSGSSRRSHPASSWRRAYATLSNHKAVELELPAAREWGERALELAERLGDDDALAEALVSTGAAEAMAEARTDRLEAGLELARARGLEQLATRAHTALVITAFRRRELDAAERILEEGLAYETARGASTRYLLGWGASVRLAQSRWDEAAADATEVLLDPRARGWRA